MPEQKIKSTKQSMHVKTSQQKTLYRTILHTNWKQKYSNFDW